jgi:hypothetical protein
MQPDEAALRPRPGREASALIGTGQILLAAAGAIRKERSGKGLRHGHRRPIKR